MLLLLKNVSWIVEFIFIMYNCILRINCKTKEQPGIVPIFEFILLLVVRESLFIKCNLFITILQQRTWWILWLALSWNDSLLVHMDVRSKITFKYTFWKTLYQSWAQAYVGSTCWAFYVRKFVFISDICYFVNNSVTFLRAAARLVRLLLKRKCEHWIDWKLKNVKDKRTITFR